MLLFLSDLHKEHLGMLKLYPVQVVVNFCKLAIDFLNNGKSIEKFTKFGERINVNVSSVTNIVQALVYLISEGCKHNLTEADFKATISMIEYSESILDILTKLYTTKKGEISELLYNLQQRDPVLEDFTWRFETQVASRSNAEIKPMLTMDFILRKSKSTQNLDSPHLQNSTNSSELLINNSIENSKTASQCQNVISHTILQSDLPNLINLTNKLEQALKESKSHNVRKVQRALQR